MVCDCCKKLCCAFGGCANIDEFLTAEDCVDVFEGVVHPGTCEAAGCPGACCVDGECSTTIQSECAGIWQGQNTTCEDGDCTETCCVGQEDGCFGVKECATGYFASLCNALGGTPDCDTESIAPPPPDSNPDCADGTPTSVTFTVSGVLPFTSPDQYLADELNQTFVVDFDPCTSSGIEVYIFTDANSVPWGVTWSASVDVAGWSVAVSLTNRSFFDFTCGLYPFASGFGATGSLTQAGLLCDGKQIMDCTGYDGTYTPTRALTYICFGTQSYNQVVDTTNAIITIA